MEVHGTVSRKDCFYGGAFPRAGVNQRVRGLSPKASGGEERTRPSRSVSFDCDSSSEELGEGSCRGRSADAAFKAKKKARWCRISFG